MSRIYIIAAVLLLVLGGVLYHFTLGKYQYNRGYQAGLAEHPTEINTEGSLTGEDIIKIREQAVREYLTTHSGTVNITKPGDTTVIVYHDTAATTAYTTIISEMQREYEAQIEELQQELYAASKPGLQPYPGQRKFGLGVAVGYVYPKLGMAGMSLEWGKTEIIPMAGYDLNEKGMKYGGILRRRF